MANRQVIHVSLLCVAVLVSSTNLLQAKEVKADYGQDSLLAEIITSQESEEIVEKGLPVARQQRHYLEDEAVLSANLAILAGEEEEKISTLATGSLVKTAILETQTGQRGAIVEYTVLEGDAVSTVAERFGVSTNTILWANNLQMYDYIRPGQKLKIPPTSGVVYTVQSGDTLEKIAQKYSGDLNKILEFNELADASAINEGQTLIIPEGKVPPPPPVSSSPRLASFTNIFGGTAPASAAASGNYNWPSTSSRISQYFTWRHAGIDIDGNYGDPIYASRGGRIVEAGWHGGYGLTVQIDHGGGVRTLYGHLTKIYVTTGQSVSQGQTIGLMGSTGYSTGSHLHFEVRINGAAYNPFNYL